MGGKGSGRRPAAPCGTVAAYKRHRRHGENCELCKQAMRAWARQRRGDKRVGKASRSNAELRQIRSARQRAIVRQWKLNAGQCASCGLVITELTVVCIDCDHVDPATKTFGIAQGIGRYTDDQLLTELRKCQALCRNCHAFRTNDEQHHLATKLSESTQYDLFNGAGTHAH